MIRVLIERRARKESERAVDDAMRELRRDVIERPGYVSGETLRDLDDPGHYVIVSTWRSREAWEAWLRSEDRRRHWDEIGAMLAEPEVVTVCEPF